MNIREHVNLKSYNTFHVSAHARYLAVVNSIEDFRQALAFSRERKLPFLLIGEGSNLLFREDYPGLVIELNINGCQQLHEDATSITLEAMCGEHWDDFVQYSLAAGAYGLENLSLIPGTI